MLLFQRAASARIGGFSSNSETDGSRVSKSGGLIATARLLSGRRGTRLIVAYTRPKSSRSQPIRCVRCQTNSPRLRRGLLQLLPHFVREPPAEPGATGIATRDGLRLRHHYGSNRFCAIHCGTVCGCFRSLSFSPNVRFQNDGLSFCAMRDDGLLGCFVLPGVRADTVLCHALFVPLATLFAPSFIV